VEASSEIAEQLEGLGKMSETAGKFLRNTGLVASYFSAGAAIKKAVKEGGIKNWTVAALKTGWAAVQTFSKVNPVAAAVVSVVDIIGTAFDLW
jgi:hypothetical protein